MRALAAALLLAACSTAATPPTRDAPLVPTQTGVDVPGTGKEIGFGRALPGAERALARLQGAPDRRPCGGAGVILVTGDLELHFPGGTFTGWRQGGRSAGRLCA